MLSEPTETLRLKLLAEEQKLRKKQPKRWTEIKFRRYANFRLPKDWPVDAEATYTIKKVKARA